MFNPKRTVIAALIAAILCTTAFAGTARARSEKDQISDAATEQFLVRWNEPRNQRFMESAVWTMTHDYARLSRVTAVLKGMQPYFAAIEKYQNGDHRAWQRLGGIKGFKNTVAHWLVSPEIAVRAFAAIVLGVSGDRTYAAQVAKLMRNPIQTTNDDEPIDRGRAAQALGMMGATEYQPQLANFLNSANQFDRVGAIYGFGYLKAKDQELAIGRLLYDKNESVRTAAEEALGWIGEPQAAQSLP